jgi:AcrR family transcriptional regulator
VPKVDEELGLRERKKQRTRVLIAETARALFAERGFDAVSVAEIARVAEVSEATVYNYFPTKEDLVYYGMEAFEEEMLAAIRTRPAGESVLVAFGRFATEPRGFLAAPDEFSARALLDASRMIATSPALLARERQILARYTDAIAGLLAEETGAGPKDLAPRVVAAALVGLHASLIDYVRRRILQDPPAISRLSRDLQSEGERAVQLLGDGLGDYAVKASATEDRSTSARSLRSAKARGTSTRAGRPSR